jgi:TIR domain/Trypsin-like peptidase domain
MQQKKDVLLSTVRIIGVFSPDKEMTLGTGFALHRDEQLSYTYIVTCAHVIEAETNKGKAEKIRVDSLYGKRDAEIISLGSRIDLDLAILAVKDLKSLPLLSPSSHITEEMPVKIPGTQLITEAKIPKTETLEGHLGKTIRLGRWRESWIIEQLDRKELQGYSGSPAIDLNDNVFGIVSTEQGEGCIALSLSVLKDLSIKDDEQKHTSLIQFISQLPDNISSTSNETDRGKKPVMETPSFSSGANETVKVFVSYVSEDESLRKEFEKHLKPMVRDGLIAIWYADNIEAGTEKIKEAKKQLDLARIILLLVSPDFLGSDYHYDVEMARAIERHEANTAMVIPIILRYTGGWEKTKFYKLQALPRDGKPVKQSQDRDEAFSKIAREIRNIAEGLKARSQ